MNPKLALAGLVVAGAFTLTAVIYATHRSRSVSESLEQPQESPAVAATAPQASQTALDQTPEAIAHRQRLAFQQRTRQFLHDASTMSAVERSERAREILLEIDRREKAKELSAGDAVLVKIGLINATIEDEGEKVMQVRELVARYRQDAARREAAWQAQQQRDAQFQDYKAREAQIVAEVMAMESFPNGLTRDDYLRLRLQEARETIYRAKP
ncbi:MAG: hypothetical protein E6Q88_03875 [Lysobacteraceae bacterium]|nr:MAG: hypothetical protein E6Q88_03875 [Xanthomonadaceae bacterium]